MTLEEARMATERGASTAGNVYLSDVRIERRLADSELARLRKNHEERWQEDALELAKRAKRVVDLTDELAALKKKIAGMRKAIGPIAARIEWVAGSQKLLAGSWKIVGNFDDKMFAIADAISRLAKELAALSDAGKLEEPK